MARQARERQASRRKDSAGPPSPEEVLGYQVGAERKIPDWPEMVSYFERLAGASDRVELEELGRSTDDNPFIAVTISSPENLARREENRALLARLYDPRATPPEEVERLAGEGRTVAFLLCTQHSNELGAALGTAALLARRRLRRRGLRGNGAADLPIPGK